MTANEQKIAAAKAAVRKRAVGYIRVSDPKQEKKYGPATQKEDIEKYCAAQGYKLLHIYQEAVTGVIWRERPVLSELREAARRDEFDIVVVGRFDRLAREDDVQTVIMEDLAYNRVKTESATQKIEDSPAGRFMLHVYGFMAEEDRRRLLRITKDGRRKRVSVHKKMLGQHVANYGYKWNEDRSAYLLNEEKFQSKDGTEWTEVEIIRRMFDMIDDGGSLRGLAQMLTKEGIPTRNGGQVWHRSTLHHILTNSCYIGKTTIFRTNRTKTPDGKTHSMPYPEEEWVTLEESIPPILVTKDGKPDIQKWERVQMRLELNKQRAVRNNHNPEATLLRGGLAFCGYCGRTLQAHRHTENNYYVYRCSKGLEQGGPCSHVRPHAQPIDDAAWKRAVEIIRNPRLVEEAIAAQTPEDKTENDLRPINSRLAAIERETKNYNRVIEKAEDDEVIDDATMHLEMLAKEKRNLEKMKKDILREKEMIEEEQTEIENFKLWCEQIREKIDDPEYILTYEEKRRACEKLGIRAIVWGVHDKRKYEIQSNPLDIVSQKS
jgi:site-specific DNA recombinase